MSQALLRIKRSFVLNAQTIVVTLRMAAAALLSFGASKALGLPEAYWAVLSAVIVTRSDVTDAIQAGILRASGTLAGCVIGLAAALAQQYGASPALSLIVMLAVVAPLSVRYPSFRVAPIAAVIVVSAARPGSGAFMVAVLRLVEIALGVAAGMSLDWLLARFFVFGPNPHQLADLFDTIAASLRPSGASDALNEKARAALRHLTLLSKGAKEGSSTARWFLLATGCYADARFFARSAREWAAGKNQAGPSDTQLLPVQIAAPLADAFEALARQMRTSSAQATSDAALTVPDFNVKRSDSDDQSTSPADKLRVQAMLFTLYRMRRQYESMVVLNSAKMPAS